MSQTNNKYNFPISDNGSYIQAPTPLPTPRENCPSAYTAQACDTCDTCNNYLTSQDADVCCHYNGNNDGIRCCTQSSQCGQVENMASCGIVVEDQLGKSEDDGCKGSKLVCTRSCSAQCLIQNSVDNNFRYMGVFQLTKGQNDPTKGCSIQQKDCSNIDNTCPAMMDTNYNPWQNCIYDVNALVRNATGPNGSSQIDEWANSKYGDTNRNFDEIMVKWCSEPVNGPCLHQTDDTCSRHFQNTDDGIKCRSWLLNQPESVQQNLQDAISSRYCPNYNTSECACVNRGLDPNYQQAKRGFPYNDGCWYTPCKIGYGYGENYFVPADVNVQINPNQCPSNVCLSVIQAGDYESTDIYGNTDVIDCS